MISYEKINFSNFYDLFILEWNEKINTEWAEKQ